MVVYFRGWFPENFLCFCQFLNFLVLSVDSFVWAKVNVSVTHCTIDLLRHLAFRNLSLLALEEIFSLIRIWNMLKRLVKVTVNSFHRIWCHISRLSYNPSSITISFWLLFFNWFLIYVGIWCLCSEWNKKYVFLWPLEGLNSNSWKVALVWYFKSNWC